MILVVNIEMSDHPSVTNGAIFYPEVAVEIGDKIITSDGKMFSFRLNILSLVTAYICREN